MADEGFNWIETIALIDMVVEPSLSERASAGTRNDEIEPLGIAGFLKEIVGPKPKGADGVGGIGGGDARYGSTKSTCAHRMAATAASSKTPPPTTNRNI